MRHENYDFIVVGGGPAGAFFAYEMLKKNPESTLKKCVKCKPFCNITCGFSGAGAFSDGKLSLYNKYDDDFYVGGNLHKYVGVEETKSLIDYTDKIYLDFGATKELEGITHPGKISNIRKSAESAGLDLINIPIRHLGTDKAHDLYKKIEETLEEAGVKMLFNTEVTDILVENNSVQGVRYESNQKQEEAYSQTVIMAVGRVGAKWLLKMCDKHKIKTKPGTIDIGIRLSLIHISEPTRPY